jgi:hypothetical protein
MCLRSEIVHQELLASPSYVLLGCLYMAKLSQPLYNLAQRWSISACSSEWLIISRSEKTGSDRTHRYRVSHKVFEVNCVLVYPHPWWCSDISRSRTSCTSPRLPQSFSRAFCLVLSLPWWLYRLRKLSMCPCVFFLRILSGYIYPPQIASESLSCIYVGYREKLQIVPITVLR